MESNTPKHTPIPWPCSAKKSRTKERSDDRGVSRLSSKKSAARDQCSTDVTPKRTMGLEYKKRNSMEMFTKCFSTIMELNRSRKSSPLSPFNPGVTRKSLEELNPGCQSLTVLSDSSDMEELLASLDKKLEQRAKQKALDESFKVKSNENTPPQALEPKKMFPLSSVSHRRAALNELLSSDDDEIPPLTERIGIAATMPGPIRKKFMLKTLAPKESPSPDKEKPRPVFRPRNVRRIINLSSSEDDLLIPSKTKTCTGLPTKTNQETHQTTGKTTPQPKADVKKTPAIDQRLKYHFPKDTCTPLPSKTNLETPQTTGKTTDMLLPRAEVRKTPATDQRLKYHFPKGTVPPSASLPRTSPSTSKGTTPSWKSSPSLYHYLPHEFESLNTSASMNNFLRSLSPSVPDKMKHPDARYFVYTFAKSKEVLTEKLYAIYNKEVFKAKLPANMIIVWKPRLLSTAGFCKLKRNANDHSYRTASIELSIKILDSPDRLRDTLIHEMCHAAVWIITGASEVHGPYWKQWCAIAMKALPSLPPITVCHTYQINTKFVYRCMRCNGKIGRHSKSIDIQRKVCKGCGGRFELLKDGKVIERSTGSPAPLKFPSSCKSYKTKSTLNHEPLHVCD